MEHAEALEVRALLSNAQLIADFTTQPVGSQPRQQYVLGNKVLFAATDVATGTELWVTDGTSEGTIRLSDVNPGIAPSDPSDFQTINDIAYFRVTDGQRDSIWRTDGTIAGTHKFFVPDGNRIYDTTVYDDALYVLSDGIHMVHTETGESQRLVEKAQSIFGTGIGVFFTKTEGGPTFFTDGHIQRRVSSASVGVRDAHTGGNIAYFERVIINPDQSSSFTTTIRSDGTAAGTFSLSETFPDASGIRLAYATDHGAFFNVFRDGEHQTYFGDGTVPGTHALPESYEFYPWWVTEFKGQVLLSANDTVHFNPVSGKTTLLSEARIVGATPDFVFLNDFATAPVYQYDGTDLTVVFDSAIAGYAVAAFSSDKLLWVESFLESGQEQSVFDASDGVITALPRIGAGRTGGSYYLHTPWDDLYLTDYGEVNPGGQAGFSERLALRSPFTLGDRLFAMEYDHLLSVDRDLSTKQIKRLGQVFFVIAVHEFDSQRTVHRSFIANGVFYVDINVNVADGGQTETEVWATDGGPATRLMTGLSSAWVQEVRGQAVLTTWSGTVQHPTTWISDGMPAGTKRVGDFSGDDFKAIGRRTVFMATHTSAGSEPHEIVLPPAIGIRKSDQLTISEHGELAVPVALTAAPESEVVVRVTVSDESEAKVISSDLVFTPEDWFEDQTAIIRGVNDRTDDGDKLVAIRASVVAAQSDTAYAHQQTEASLVVVDVHTAPALKDGVLSITGSNDNDRLFVAASVDTITVRQNDATFSFAANAVRRITIDSGAGNDQIQSLTELRTTVLAGEGDDTIITGAGRDFIRAEAGNDLVQSSGGRDAVFGGSGNDLINTGSDRDKAFGGKGKDTIRGAAGADVLFGNSGDDILVGGDGSDRILGSSGSDLLLGDAGDDSLFGGRGRDVAFGGGGADVLKGGSHDDILVSGDGTADLTDLTRILREWKSHRDYRSRVQNIRGPGAADRLNGDSFLVSGSTVHPDARQDTIFGLGARDWFFSELTDQLSDRSDREDLDVL